MRACVLGATVAAMVILPQMSSAQVYLLPTPAPRVTAAWHATGKPLFYKGSFYYPTGPTEFFDGDVMARTGTFEGVPLYENRTLEPYAVVFVPIGGKLMRPYERRREGDLAGTVGSRMPSFPIQRDVEVASIRDEPDRYRRRVASGRAQWDWPEPPSVQDAPPLTQVLTVAPAGASAAPVIRAIPVRDTTNAGPFLSFENARYYSSGKAVRHDLQRFAQVGAVEGAAIFRELNGSDRTIFVEAVPGGPLAPVLTPVAARHRVRVLSRERRVPV